jgi:hypothetical protein
VKLNNKLTYLAAVIDSTVGPPTPQTKAVFADLSRRVDQQTDALKALMEGEIAEFNQIVYDLKVPAIILKHAKHR